MVLTVQEVQTLLSHMAGTEALLAVLLYGRRLRLREALGPQVKNVDFDRHACWRRLRSEPYAEAAVIRLDHTEIQARRRMQLVFPGSVAGRQTAQIGAGVNYAI